MSNPFSDFDNVQDPEAIEMPNELFDSLIEFEEYDVDIEICHERHNSIIELERDMTDIAVIWSHLSEMIDIQGQDVDTVEKQIETTVKETSEGVSQLEQAAEYLKGKYVIVRDVSLVVGGGILGAAGLFLGPLVGVGTILAGVSAGGATVAGIHKYEKNEDSESENQN